MLKSPKARKESSKREREGGRMPEEGLNPFRKSSRIERSPTRSEERNHSKEIDKKIKNISLEEERRRDNKKEKECRNRRK
jgi:hypothetical protein